MLRPQQAADPWAMTLGNPEQEGGFLRGWAAGGGSGQGVPSFPQGYSSEER